MQIKRKSFILNSTNEFGSALLQVLLLIGSLSIVFLAVTRLLFVNRNMANEITSRMRVDSLHAMIYSQLLDVTSCYNTFQAISKTAVPFNVTAATPVRDNNPSLASSLPLFTVGSRYLYNVTINSITLSNFTANVPYDPFNATFNVQIVYRVPYGEGSSKDFSRNFLIRTTNPAHPGAWADGSPLADVVTGCVSSAPPGSSLQISGIGLDANLSLKFTDVKNSNFNIYNNGGTPGRLFVNGNLIANSLFQLSDDTTKQNIKKMEIRTSVFSKIKGYKFNWKDNQMPDVGFKAQEIAKYFPELVQKDEKGFLAVDYFSYVPILLEHAKYLDKKNRNLEEQISLLEQKIKMSAHE